MMYDTDGQYDRDPKDGAAFEWFNSDGTLKFGETKRQKRTVRQLRAKHKLTFAQLIAHPCFVQMLVHKTTYSDRSSYLRKYYKRFVAKHLNLLTTHPEVEKRLNKFFNEFGSRRFQYSNFNFGLTKTRILIKLINWLKNTK